MRNKQNAISDERMKATVEEFFRWLPKGLAQARAEGESIPFYMHIDAKTGELTSLLFGQEALDAMKEA
ncbi:hypothetical protein [Nemorincola caseinilytica]